MKISLRIICSASDEASVTEQAHGLLEIINADEDTRFQPYWKDDRCVVLDTCGDISEPDYTEITGYVFRLSGTNHVKITEKPDSWECSYYANIEEITAGDGIAFVTCEIWN